MTMRRYIMVVIVGAIIMAALCVWLISSEEENSWRQLGIFIGLMLLADGAGRMVKRYKP